MLEKTITNKQAVEYLKNKKITPTDKTAAEIAADWSDDAKARAFFSARVSKADVLEGMRKRILQVAEGKMSAQQARYWIREFLTTDGASALREMGFLAGEEDMNDNNRLSELGSTRRLKLIIEQNVRNAQAAGEYDGFVETKSVYPYAEYKTAGDEKVRGSHAILNGKVYEVGTPEMRAVYPPNDYYCRCRFRQLRADELNGRKVQRTAPPVNELAPSGFSFDPALKPEPLQPKKSWSPDILKAYAGTGKITPEIRKAAKDAAKEKFSGQTVKNIYSGQEIIMSFKGAKHTISECRTCVGIDLLDSAFDIAENGEPKGFEPDKSKKRNIKGVWRFEKEVPTRAGMIMAELIVRETTDGMLFYHVQGIKSGQAPVSKKSNPPGQIQ
jgi:SPP1 gp7 family putative phage head morphogenesis protein